MTTKELIEMLQKEDPEGSCHVRVGGGYPLRAERKAGYWDGPYMYERDKKLYYSTKGDKVDLYTGGLEEWVENLVYRHEDITDEEIKERIVFELGYVHNEDRIEQFLKNAKKHADEMRSIIQSVEQQCLWRVLEKVRDGWSIYFDGKMNWFYKKGLKKESMGNGVGYMVKTCGFFEEFKPNQWRPIQ